MNRTRFIQGLNSNIELSDKEREDELYEIA